MKQISTSKAPAPRGHYSQGIIHNGIVYVAGQLPINPETGKKIVGTIEEQTEQALKNVAAILEEAGSSMDRVVKTTVYISEIQLWNRVNKVYAKHFSTHRPARVVVPTGLLHHGFQIEIEAIAAVKS